MIPSNRQSKTSNRQSTTGGSFAWFALAGLTSSLMISGCYRSSPPEIPEFLPPPRPAARVLTTPEAVKGKTEAWTEEPKPEPEPESTSTPAASAAPPPEAKPTEVVVVKPSLIGTWLVLEFIQNGQAMPLPEGMEMTMTFAEGGSVSMKMSSEMMPEGQAFQGTYVLDGDRMTVSMQGQTRSGTYSFDGDTLTLDFEDGRMVLSRY